MTISLEIKSTSSRFLICLTTRTSHRQAGATTARRRLARSPPRRQMAVAGADDEATPLFPALSPAQRYHFEVYGYVIVPQLLTESETSSLLA
eukprot:COSAG02_NODE_40015_length_410_cov_0.659164_1_plen_91_part_10